MVRTARRGAGNTAQVAHGAKSREPMLELGRRDQTPASLCPLTLAALGKVLSAQQAPGGSLAGSARRAGTCQGKWHGGTPVPALENAASVGSRDRQPSEDRSSPCIIGQSGTMEEHQEKTEGTRSLPR